MAIEPRKPPPQFVAKLKRVLGGRSGLSGIVLQLLFAAALVWIGYEIIANARMNLQAQRIASGFGFLDNTAGFGVSQALIPYAENDSYTRVFFVGLLNTLAVSIVGIIFATILGFIIGLGRMSPNWLVARLCGGYVEIVRNLPLLFQILFWYLAVLAALPNPRQSLSLFGLAFVNSRGIIVPKPIEAAGFGPFLIALAIAIVFSIAARIYARRALYDRGAVITVWPYTLGAVIGLPLLAALIFGAPVTFELPVLRGFNFAGGSRIIPEFVALALALATYTAAFIAEIARAGITSVHKGQMEAGSSLGLSRGQTLRLIVVPQAMRVILPPLTNQYLNLTKNSSLAVAIGYPDLFSVFAGTTLSQTGQAIEIIVITMGVYLLISLVTSAIMNLYGSRISQDSYDTGPNYFQLGSVGVVAFVVLLLLFVIVANRGLPTDPAFWPVFIYFLLSPAVILTCVTVYLTLFLSRLAAASLSVIAAAVALSFAISAVGNGAWALLCWAFFIAAGTAFTVSVFRLPSARLAWRSAV